MIGFRGSHDEKPTGMKRGFPTRNEWIFFYFAGAKSNSKGFFGFFVLCFGGVHTFLLFPPVMTVVSPFTKKLVPKFGTVSLAAKGTTALTREKRNIRQLTQSAGSAVAESMCSTRAAAGLPYCDGAQRTASVVLVEVRKARVHDGMRCIDGWGSSKEQQKCR